MPPSSPGPAKRIDWDAVRARLDRALLAAAEQQSPDRAAAVLARRAQEAARGAAPEEAARAGEEMVVFQLAEQPFAVEARQVRETVFPRDLTRLPGLPEHVRGVVNVRSRIVPAVDLRPLLHLPPSAAPQEEKLLIVEHEGTEFGVLADRVVGLRSIDGALRREVPGLDERFLRGLAVDGTVVLSLAALFPELVVDDEPESRPANASLP